MLPTVKAVTYLSVHSSQIFELSLLFAGSAGLTVGAGKSSLSIGMGRERRWNVTDLENRRNRKEKNLSRCHVVCRTYHMDWSENESGTLRLVQ